jgi:hypothetical protein
MTVAVAMSMATRSATWHHQCSAAVGPLRTLLNLTRQAQGLFPGPAPMRPGRERACFTYALQQGFAPSGATNSNLPTRSRHPTETLTATSARPRRAALSSSCSSPAASTLVRVVEAWLH